MTSHLRTYLNLFTLAGLPEDSTGPRDLGDPRALFETLVAAGYEGVQGYEIEIAGVPAADPKLCGELGLGCATAGLVHRPGTIDRDAQRWADSGFEAATIHVGNGLEDDDTAHALLDEVVAASDRHSFPLYIETHRATLTQDTWRTVQLTKAHPEIRFNGDFSHWYTGLEMTYGDFDAKLRFLAPVFERTRFLHGRIGRGRRRPGHAPERRPLRGLLDGRLRGLPGDRRRRRAHRVRPRAAARADQLRPHDQHRGHPIDPEGDVVAETMGEVVRNTTSQLTPADLNALIAYLRTLPPVPNEKKS